MSPTTLLPLVRLEIRQHIQRRRWLLPLALVLFISSNAANGARIQSANHALGSNAWDALFGVFANQKTLFYALTLPFLYLVSDFLPESGFGQVVLLWVGSRRLWWSGKVLTLALATFAYLVVSVGLAAAIASLSLPWQGNWSQSARQFPLEFCIAPAALAIPPALAAGQLVLLLALGWFSLGLLVVFVSQLAGRSILGLGAGFFALLGGQAALMGDVRPPYSYLLVHQHLLLFDFHSFGKPSLPYLPVTVSVVYWMIWIALLFELGRRLSLKQDLLG